MLLYLNEQTWIGADGDRLASEVRRARQIDLDIHMVHEFDPAKGGCEFVKFFQTSAHASTPHNPKSRQSRPLSPCTRTRTPATHAFQLACTNHIRTNEPFNQLLQPLCD